MYTERNESSYHRFLNRIPVVGDVLKRPNGMIGFIIVII